MKTPGQIAYEGFYNYKESTKVWNSLPSTSTVAWERAAQAVLSSQWRSVDDPPENDREVIIVAGKNTVPNATEFRFMSEERTHWMPIPEIPKSKDREEFEKWAKEHFTNSDIERRQDIAWKAWQAAKATK